MKAILINPFDETIKEAVYSGNYKEIYDLIECRTFTEVRLNNVDDMYLDDEGNVIDGLSLKSYLSSGIPGTVAGLIFLHEKESSLPLKDLIKPAIDLAENGFKLSKFQSEYLNRNEKKI